MIPLLILIERGAIVRHPNTEKQANYNEIQNILYIDDDDDEVKTIKIQSTDFKYMKKV